MHPLDDLDAAVLNTNGSVRPAAQLDLDFAARGLSVLSQDQDIALPTTVVKRDGRLVPFDPMRIERALSRCFAALGREPYTPIAELALRVVNIMCARPGVPSVELVQDAVELTLQAAGEFEAAKAYILYRAEHAKQRQERPIPEDVRQAFSDADRYFPTPIQKFQFFDKYARFDYAKGRRETWIETVDRAVDFLHELVQTNTGVDLGSETYEHVRRMILEMRSMPSMRLLAMAGAPARRDNTSIYNCLSGDERILTREKGVIPLRDAVGTVTVLNQDRKWVPAEVHSFGTQQTVQVSLGRSKTQTCIRATWDHEWQLVDGRRVRTGYLKPGDQVRYTLAVRRPDTGSIDYRLGVMHGIVYGDGTEVFSQERSRGYMIRLCGSSRELVKHFETYRVSYPPSYGGDPVVYLCDDFAKTHRLKQLPPVEETDDYLIGFIRGWFAADGYISKAGQMSFAVDDIAEAYLRQVGPRVGFDFGYAVQLADETNFGHRKSKTRNLELRRASVSEDDLLLSKHVANYVPATVSHDWKVLGLVPGSEQSEEVFCATVPETHTFTLADGILTGNCSYLPVESIDSFAEALLISMAGCGVGFSVESAYVENFPRVHRQRGLSALSHTVEDSAQGWAAAVRLGMQAWFDGADVEFNFDQIRPAGAPLRTKGGRASGPGPLKTMLEFARARILARQGMHLRPIDAHDIMCMVGNAAVSGGVRRCLPAGTRVHTQRGAVPIEEIREGDRVMTAVGYKPVTGWVDQGVQRVVEIVTESGTIFRCTPHHRVAVLTDVWGGHTFKYAAELTPEDRLLFITHPIDGELQPLHQLPPKHFADHSGSVVRQPVLDVETAWFLGKFLADGYAQVGAHDAAGKRGNTQFSVSCNLQETDQIDRVSHWMEGHGLKVQRLFGQSGWLTLRSSNRQIARWMQHYKRPKMVLSVPEEIWRAPASIRAAFLAGLMDGDGCFTDRPVTVVSTVYEQFAREIVKLLATLGIIAEVRLGRPENERGWQALWIVTIKDSLALQRAEQLVGQHACTQWVSRTGEQAGYSVPGWMVRRDVPRQEWAPVWPAGRDAAMNSATLTSMVTATHYVPVGVREVRRGGEAHTYDIEVRDGSMFVAEGYLVHNTAMISLFDYDDLEMRLCKSGDFEHENSQRWNANNSAVWPERGLDQLQVMEQVLDMVRSQRGEPGIFNRKAALELIPERRQAFGYQEYGTNPCITADSWILTAHGPRQVRDLIGVQHQTIVNGRAFSTTAQGFWRSGSRRVVRLTTREGYSLRLTSNHRLLSADATWREVGELRAGDRIQLNNHRGVSWSGAGSEGEGWLLGSLLGDGTFSTKLGSHGQLLTMAHLDYWGDDAEQIASHARELLTAAVATRRDCLGVRFAPQNKFRLSSAGLARLAEQYGLTPGHKAISPAIETTSSDFYAGFLRGLFDADGSVQGTHTKGVSVRLSQSNLATLEAVQRMLLRLGIVSTLYRDRRTAGYRQLPDGHGGSRAYWNQPQHELVIANDNLHEFARSIGFSDPGKHARLSAALEQYRRAPNREQFTATIESIQPDGVEDVYDCSVPGPNAFDANGFVSHNCGEIILRKYEFCNLSICVARSDDTFETLKEKVQAATIIGTIQSLGTYFPDLRPIWKQNCEEERLLGVDITGQMDSPLTHDPEVMRALRQVATDTNRELAARLGINQSAAITTVKPSGNSSQLLNCSSGLHARWAPYYERNVRVAATSPIFKVLRDAGVPMDPENGQTREDANCVTPDTRVLTNDLRWVRAGDLKAGDGIIGFDEFAPVGKTRHYRTASITYAGRKLSRVLCITLDDGQVLRCTPDHKWLVLDAGGTAVWMTAEELLRQSGRKNFHIRLPRYWNVYDTDTSSGAGYLAGLLDGEGSLGAVARTTNVGCIQNEGGVYTRGVTELEARGYQVVTRAKQRGLTSGDECRPVAVLGGRSELLRLPSEVRPMRRVDTLVSRIHTLSLVAFSLPSITSVEEDGTQEIAVLSSSCQTYLAEGFAAHNTWVIHFPIQSPDGAVTRKDRGAIEQCNYWLHNKLNWTDHNPSITVTYRPDEIIELTRWIWEHRDLLGGMAFLPAFDAQYAQLPYIEITKEEFERRVADFPEIDFSKLWRYESTDLTAAAQELACLAGQCEADP